MPSPEPRTRARRCDETGHRAAAALSGHVDTRTAAIEVADRLYDELGGECDLVLVFASFHHRAAFPEAVRHLRRTLGAAPVLGVTSESVLGVDEECEGKAGLAVLALRLPGARLRPWQLEPDRGPQPRDPASLREHLGVDGDARGLILLADPFTVPVRRWLPALSGCRPGDARLPVAGGMASGASQPGHNVLILDDRSASAGAVGVTVGGAVQLDFVVSQGARPVGDPFVVTKVQGQTILELGGKVPMAALKAMTLELNEKDRALLNKGLLVGVVIDEYKGRFGRGDFLVRNVTALDLKRGVISVADQLRAGQTIQFHVRDADTASEDLQLLLDAQQLEAPPVAAMLFTCNGRGTRLFPEANHDIAAVQARLGQIPTAGFFAAGEVGPIGSESFLHGHTASLVLVRARKAES